MLEESTTLTQGMPDVQQSYDARNIPIDKVGVRNIRYPITLRCPATQKLQHTVARINMYVHLSHEQKGTHMSRFLEVLNEHRHEIRYDQIRDVCRDIKQRLAAQEAHLELMFPYFIHKLAPVTRAPGMIDVEVTFECTLSEARSDFLMGIKVPATSLCPCSKEISAYGAHNQRCEIEVRASFGDGETMWIEELFELVERSASASVFAVLKRPDEKWVTEAAYDNPKFVEDIVRDLALQLDAEKRIRWYQAQSENFESIHNHNAYAFIEREKQD